MAVFPVHFMQRTNEQLEEEMEENGQVVISNGFTFGTLGKSFKSSSLSASKLSHRHGT